MYIILCFHFERFHSKRINRNEKKHLHRKCCLCTYTIYVIFCIWSSQWEKRERNALAHIHTYGAQVLNNRRIDAIRAQWTTIEQSMPGIAQFDETETFCTPDHQNRLSLPLPHCCCRCIRHRIHDGDDDNDTHTHYQTHTEHEQRTKKANEIHIVSISTACPSKEFLIRQVYTHSIRMDESNFKCGCLHTFRFRDSSSRTHKLYIPLSLWPFSKFTFTWISQNNEWTKKKKRECAYRHKSGCSTHNSTPVNRNAFLVKVCKRLNIPWKWFGILYFRQSAFALIECAYISVKFPRNFLPICKRNLECTEAKRKHKLFQVIEWRAT